VGWWRAFKVKKTVSKENSSGGSSYGQILKSSSIIGGAQGINYVIGLVRTKIVAVLLGPSGVGLVGLYVSINGLVQTVAQFGVDQSGVREVAAAASEQDPKKVASTVKTMRRVCWFTGIFGWMLSITFAWPLAQWTFGSAEHKLAIAVLGGAILLESIAGGQMALIQGLRRIGDLARMQVSAAILTTIMAVGLYWWLGESGIVPVIIVTSGVQLVCSWWFAKRIDIPEVSQTWLTTWRQAGSLLKLGSAFMYGALLAAVAGLIIRSLIVRDLGLDAAGIYQAAWALSGMFAGFVLRAIAADFYPRLTSVVEDDGQVNRLVNEQIETGILLTMPGILVGVVLSDAIIHLLYSIKFTVAGDLLPWFLLGVFAQVVSWPLGALQVAKKATAHLYATKTLYFGVQVSTVMLLIQTAGLFGVSLAFALQMCFQVVVSYWIANKLSGFRPNRRCLHVMLIAIAITVISFFLKMSVPAPWNTAFGILVAVTGGVICLKMLSQRLIGDRSLLGILKARFG
jgi:antigen flippase